MTQLAVDALTNPVWAALTTRHRGIAAGTARALRYPREVVPFAAVQHADSASLADLRDMLEGEETVWLVGPQLIPHDGLQVVGEVDCYQMVVPPEMTAPRDEQTVVELSASNAAEMLALTEVAFPGFFRARTHVLGTYVGIRSAEGELVAMAGERFACGEYREMSAVCTHPSFRGRGLASALIWHLIRAHRAAGLVSWLHVATDNTTAVRLYRSLGFTEHAVIHATRVARDDIFGS